MYECSNIIILHPIHCIMVVSMEFCLDSVLGVISKYFMFTFVRASMHFVCLHITSSYISKHSFSYFCVSYRLTGSICFVRGSFLIRTILVYFDRFLLVFFFVCLNGTCISEENIEKLRFPN